MSSKYMLPGPLHSTQVIGVFMDMVDRCSSIGLPQALPLWTKEEENISTSAERDMSSTELESGNATERFLQTTTPILDKISGPMCVQFLSSIGLAFGTLIGKARLLPIRALDKN